MGQLARIVDDLKLDVFAFGISTDLRMTSVVARAAALSPDVGERVWGSGRLSGGAQ